MEYKYILYEPGRVARIKLNRPRYRNAISFVMIEELHDAFTRADADDEVEVIVLSGEGSNFSGGHDLGSPEWRAENEERGFTKDDKSKYATSKEYHLDMYLQWRNLKKPTIAMVQGWVIFGGYMLAAAMDIVFASEDAKLLPGQLQYFTVPWDIGPRKAKEVLFEHRVMTAHEARDLGLVNRVYPNDKLEEETLAFANRVADNFRDRVRGCKLAINHMMDTMGFSVEMDYAFHTHHLLRQLAYDSEEAVEAGVRGESSRERRVGRPADALKNLELKQKAEV